MESCVRRHHCHGGPPPWLTTPTLRDGWLGRSASTLTKRTCCVLNDNIVFNGDITHTKKKREDVHLGVLRVETLEIVYTLACKFYPRVWWSEKA